MKIGALIFTVILFGSIPPASAINQNLPAAYAENSEFTISYDDWDIILSAVVMETGLSDRRPATRNGARVTGSRINHGNTNATAFEGNRVLFYKFKQEHRDSLLAIRKDLEAVPDFIPFENLSKNEQLAYWLNLHNVAVMLEVSKAYPVKKVKWIASGENNIWEQKIMSIGGVPTSIADIERHVVANWNTPLVLYGFFMGTVGGPNIRATAFTSENVIGALRSNAVEFVNSLRGYRLWSGHGRVSEHYKLGMRYFPDFDEDIKKHLLKYSRQRTRRALEGVDTFQADNYDWAIADLRDGDTYNGGGLNRGAGFLALFAGGGGGITAFNDGSFDKGRGTAPPQIKRFVGALHERNRRRSRNATVTVEEFVDSDGGRVSRKNKEEKEPVSPNKDDEDKPII